MATNTEVPVLIQCLAIYDETEGDLKGLIDVELRGHGFLADAYTVLDCSSVDYLDFGNGLWLYAAGNSLAKGKNLNVPAMILADTYGCGQIIYGPVLIAALRNDGHISLSEEQYEEVQSTGKALAGLGWAGIYNKMMAMLARHDDRDGNVELLDSWMAPRTGIANFSGKDYM